MQHIPAGRNKKEVESVMDSQEECGQLFQGVYADREGERYGNLYRAYLQGTFPQGNSDRSRRRKRETADSLYYARDTSTFYLPERELYG